MTTCKGQHTGCPACMAYYLKHHANSCTYGKGMSVADREDYDTISDTMHDELRP